MNRHLFSSKFFRALNLVAILLGLISWTVFSAMAENKKHTSEKKQSDTTHHADTHHDHATQHSQMMAQKPTKKFSVDEDLKVRMGAVLNTMKALHAAEAKKTQKEMKSDQHKNQYAEAGRKIETTVQDIFKTCKLAPDADAAIHPILAELLSGAALLKKGNAKEGHEKIHKALLTYEDYFAHPGWDHSRYE